MEFSAKEKIFQTEKKTKNISPFTRMLCFSFLRTNAVRTLIHQICVLAATSLTRLK